MEIEIDIDSSTERKVYSVSELTRGIRYALEDKFSSIWIEGEISGFTHHSSGHMYFSIKDKESSLQCVMFKRDNSRLKFTPEIGMKVVCKGRISVYVPRGQYQLTADYMEPQGVGDLQIAFEQLKKKLLKEGLFDDANKKSIPSFPEKIGIVTSLTGAVIHDMIRVWNRRYPGVQIVISPAKVQGEGSKEEIVDAIKTLNEHDKVDVIVLARGGGSMEDLWSFNEEVVARAIFASKIPVVSAIGHEVDYTISDFVADFRAPTPSAAAEILLPIRDELLQKIDETQAKLLLLLQNRLASLNERMQHIKDSRVFKDGHFLLESSKNEVESLAANLHKNAFHLFEVKKKDLLRWVGQLEALSPLACLKRGYGVVFDEDTESIIKSTFGLKLGQPIHIQLHDGKVAAKVEDIIVNSQNK